MDLSVEFKGEAHKLVSVPGDFFVNLGTAMPGDHFEDVVDVSNTTEKEAELFFYTAVKGQDSSQLELLKGIQLMIFMNDKKTVQGNSGFSWTGERTFSWKLSAGSEWKAEIYT